jgi:hypothetical protein
MDLDFRVDEQVRTARFVLDTRTGKEAPPHHTHH